MKIIIDQKLCKGCFFCLDECPKNVLDSSEELSPKGYHIIRVKSPNECIKCRVCEIVCPDFAISLE